MSVVSMSRRWIVGARGFRRRAEGHRSRARHEGPTQSAPASGPAQCLSSGALAVAAVLEAINTGRLASIDATLTADFVDHSAPFDVPVGPAGYKQVLHYATAVLQESCSVNRIVDAGSHIVVWATTFGTGVDEVHGSGAEGRPYAISTLHVFAVVGSRLSEHWCERDDVAALRQLGVLDYSAELMAEADL